ncbi:hypothetical protein [Nonomuraea longicatena]
MTTGLRTLTGHLVTGLRTLTSRLVTVGLRVLIGRLVTMTTRSRTESSAPPAAGAAATRAVSSRGSGTHRRGPARTEEYRSPPHGVSRRS